MLSLIAFLIRSKPLIFHICYFNVLEYLDCCGLCKGPLVFFLSLNESYKSTHLSFMSYFVLSRYTFISGVLFLGVFDDALHTIQVISIEWQDDCK